MSAHPSSFGRRLAVVIIGRPWRTIGIAMVAMLALIAGIAQLRYIGDLDTTLPESSALTHEIRAVRSLFGSNDTAVFVIDGPDAAARIAAACRLAERLAADPDVPPRTLAGLGTGSTNLLANRAGALNVEKGTAPCRASGMSMHAAIDGLGPQRDFLVGGNGALVIYADLDIKNGAYLPFRDRANGYIAEIARADKGVTILMTGQPSFLSAIQVYSQRMGLFFPLIMLVIGALHYEALRSVQAVVLPLLAGLLATLLTVGSMGWLGVALDEYSSTAPILVLAVAAGHSVQLLKRYMEELSGLAVDGMVTRAANQQALIATLGSMTPVLAAAVITAALCLLSLTAFDIKAVARFGMVAAGGLLYALVIELSLIPAIRAVRPPKPVDTGYGGLRPHWQRLLEGVYRMVISTRPRHAIVIALVMIAAGVWGISKLRRTASIMEPFAAMVPERRAITELGAQQIGTFPLDIVFDSGRADGAFEPALLAVAADLEQRLRADRNIAAVASPLSVMRFLKCRLAELADCDAVTIRSQEEASQIWTLFSGPGDAYPLVDPDWRYLRLRAFAYSDDSGVMGPVEALVRATVLPTDTTVQLGGPAIMAKALGDGIFRATGHKVIVIILVSGLAGCLIFRSLMAGLLFMIPSCVSAGATYAFLGWTGTTLNVATASIAALAVGVGVDYLVYFTFRLREYLRLGIDWQQALSASYQTAGGASLCVATAVAGGYAVLNLSFGFRVHQWLGELIPLAVLAGLAATLILYPIMLNLLRPRFLDAARRASSR